MHFVSSVAALPVGERGEERFYSLSASQMQMRDGYGQTKAVAERLLLGAHERFGLPVSVYRPSVICGDSSSGFSNQARPSPFLY